MKTIRTYKITTTEAEALKHLNEINTVNSIYDVLRGLKLVEETKTISETCEETTYYVVVTNDEYAWDTIVDGKNLFYRHYLLNSVNSVSTRIYNRRFRAMKSLCQKDIEMTFGHKFATNNI